VQFQAGELAGEVQKGVLDYIPRDVTVSAEAERQRLGQVPAAVIQRLEGGPFATIRCRHQVAVWTLVVRGSHADLARSPGPAPKRFGSKAAWGLNPASCRMPSAPLRLALGPSALLCLGVLRTRGQDGSCERSAVHGWAGRSPRAVTRGTRMLRRKCAGDPERTAVPGPRQWAGGCRRSSSVGLGQRGRGRSAEGAATPQPSPTAWVPAPPTTKP